MATFQVIDPLDSSPRTATVTRTRLSPSRTATVINHVVVSSSGGEPAVDGATLTGTGTLSATDKVPGPFDNPYPNRPGIGWEFYLLHPGGLTEPLYFSVTGNYTYDSTRDITRTIDGFILTPEEFSKVDMVRDKVLAYLAIDGVPYPMGVFRFVDSSAQCDAVRIIGTSTNGSPYGVTYGATAIPYSWEGPYSLPLLPGGTTGAADLHNVQLADIMTDLKRNDGTAQTLYTGFDAGQEMARILQQDGVPYAVANALAPSRNDVTWDGSVTDLEKVDQLAVLAGHRQPWSDNLGVVRSVSAGQVQGDVLVLDDLKPTAESIIISDSYLTAPNRVIVVDNSSTDLLVAGQWDAPSSAPHSFANLGYHRTQIVDQQGLGSVEHAQQVAAALGEEFTARKLDCEIKPTNLLDGPRVISFRGAYWLVVSWSISTEPGATMSITCQELL
jgi:hypothetical protein